MSLSMGGLIGFVALLVAGCSARQGDGAGAAAQLVYTELDAGSCVREIDPGDPNETPYLRCPGVGDYALIVRRVDAGRASIDIVSPEGQVFPLSYEEFVTRNMFTLDGRAAWRVVMNDGEQVPVALIVRVHAREDEAEPERVTRTVFAVAKVTPEGACVTESIAEDARTEDEVRGAADSAWEKPCAPPQPPMTEDGVEIR
jgi:hypothetical protein